MFSAKPLTLLCIGVARGVQMGHASPQILEHIAILYFERRFSKQNRVIRQNQIFWLPKIFGLAMPLLPCLSTKRSNLHLSSWKCNQSSTLSHRETFWHNSGTMTAVMSSPAHRSKSPDISVTAYDSPRSTPSSSFTSSTEMDQSSLAPPSKMKQDTSDGSDRWAASVRTHMQIFLWTVSCLFWYKEYWKWCLRESPMTNLVNKRLLLGPLGNWTSW